MAALSANLTELSISVGRVIAEPGDRVEHIYFPNSGVVSIIAVMRDGRDVESLTVGREGAVGLLAALGDGLSDSRALVQITGTAWRIGAAHLRAAVTQHPAILDVVLRYAQATEANLHQGAACNAVHGIEPRLCRWLLICEDRVGDDVLPLTHEFLATMLGVQRTSVTGAAKALQRRGLIDYRRGRITILDRAGLERAACECYRATEDIYARVLGAGRERGAKLA